MGGVVAVKRNARAVGKTEKVVSGLILAALVAVAAGVFRVQEDLNPAVFPLPAETRPGPGDPQTAAGALLSTLPEPLTPLGPMEVFDAATLSDKIDGKAELYLSAGFQSLKTQRFGVAGEADLWLEAYAYDMGGAQNAFAVFSAQRREGAALSPAAREAYKTANALFMVHGDHYVEIVASGTGEPVERALDDLAAGFVREHPAAPTVLGERDLFPRTGLVPDSIVLISADAFGFDRLDNVFTAVYRSGDGEVTAFLSRRDSPEAAEALAEAYGRFLLAFGGRELDPPIPADGVREIDILDALELIFVRGPFLGGVHEAENRAFARSVATELMAGIAKAAHGP